jgi:hypothetical protein
MHASFARQLDNGEIIAAVGNLPVIAALIGAAAVLLRQSK